MDYTTVRAVHVRSISVPLTIPGTKFSTIRHVQRAVNSLDNYTYCDVQFTCSLVRYPSFITPTPFTSSPTSFPFIRYNSHFQNGILIKTHLNSGWKTVPSSFSMLPTDNCRFLQKRKPHGKVFYRRANPMEAITCCVRFFLGGILHQPPPVSFRKVNQFSLLKNQPNRKQSNYMSPSIKTNSQTNNSEVMCGLRQ
jgi:hypothetical protein